MERNKAGRAGLIAARFAAIGDKPWTRVGLLTAVAGGALMVGMAIWSSDLIPSGRSQFEPVNSAPIGVPAARAIKIAREHVLPDAVFVSATAGPYSEIHTFIELVGALDFPRDRLVWGVVFESQFEICPPDGSPCFSPRPGWTTVMLDYFTGEFLGSAAYSPP